MMKYVFILFPVLLIAQPQSEILFLQNYQKATVLNGTSQYWTKSSPSNLDLNGSEMITATDDRTFESTVGNWGRAGTVSAAVRSTVDKRTGTASMRATSSGAGDTTSNYITLNYPNFGAIVSGNKYTLELWARSATASRTITLRIGDATVTSGTLSTTFASFTKVVLNFQATANTVNKPIYILTSAAIDSLYIDDVSLTQAYDALVISRFMRSGSPSGNSRIFSMWASATGGFINGLVGGSSVARATVGDGVGAVALNSNTAVTDGTYHILATTINRITHVTVYVDGRLDSTPSSITSLGKVPASAIDIRVGVDANTAGYFDGKVSFVQIVRFAALPSNIAQTISRISAQNKPLSVYENGEIVAWYDWQSGGTDKSGSGNHLTPVNNPIIVNAK